jgi:hypothetical protein
VTTASGLAQTGADATAYAALGMLGAVCGLDAVEFHEGPLRDFDQVADLVDHAAHCRRVLQFADAVELAQAQAADGGTVRFLGADRAAHQLES